MLSETPTYNVVQKYHNFDDIREKLANIKPFEKIGFVYAVSKTLVKAKLRNVSIGEICRIESNSASRSKARYIDGEITLINGDDVNISFAGGISDIFAGSIVYASGHSFSFSMSRNMVGSVIDEKGRSESLLEDSSSSEDTRYFEIDKSDVLSRKPINEIMLTGVKSIDGCLTLGKGQRIGLFGPAGCGKSTLIGMIARNCAADIVIVALVGERGREVNDFLQKELSPENRSKCIVFFSTSDSSPIERIWSTRRAIIAAEYFSSLGHSVLFLMDSLTRYCRAQRELALQSGEVPVRQGFPPSVFDDIPKLVERTGNFESGCITSVFVVLQESSDMSDVLAEEVMSLLDGHIILSRELAQSSHYPAIDVMKSNSRLMHRVVAQKEVDNANKLKSLQKKYGEIELLVQLGEYEKGTDLLGDSALKCHDQINAFLMQAPHETVIYNDLKMQLKGAVSD